jgi:hypothetical protein
MSLIGPFFCQSVLRPSALKIYMDHSTISRNVSQKRGPQKMMICAMPPSFIDRKNASDSSLKLSNHAPSWRLVGFICLASALVIGRVPMLENDDLALSIPEVKQSKSVTSLRDQSYTDKPASASSWFEWIKDFNALESHRLNLKPAGSKVREIGLALDTLMTSRRQRRVNNDCEGVLGSTSRWNSTQGGTEGNDRVNPITSGVDSHIDLRVRNDEREQNNQKLLPPKRKSPKGSLKRTGSGPNVIRSAKGHGEGEGSPKGDKHKEDKKKKDDKKHKDHKHSPPASPKMESSVTQNQQPSVGSGVPKVGSYGSNHNNNNGAGNDAGSSKPGWKPGSNLAKLGGKLFGGNNK